MPMIASVAMASTAHHSTSIRRLWKLNSPGSDRDASAGVGSAGEAARGRSSMFMDCIARAAGPVAQARRTTGTEILASADPARAGCPAAPHRDADEPEARDQQ